MFKKKFPFGVVRIPWRNEFVEGAMLEPVNTVLKAVRRLSLLRGDHVLVAGQGPIGLIFTRLLTLAGMRVVGTDLLPERLKLARTWGARLALTASEPARLEARIERFTRGRGLDAAVIAVPSDTALHHGMSMLRGGGELLLFAHTRRGPATAVDLASVCVDEKDLLGCYSADITLQRETAKIVFRRHLDVRSLATHFLDLGEVDKAIALASSPSPESLKVFVTQQ